VKALVFEAPWRMALLERPEPEPGPGEVLVAVRAAGICGSDVHGYTGSTGRRTPGVVMGHEVAGEVVSGAGGVGAGTRVALNPLVACGSCRACLEGRPNVCERRLGIGWSVDGGFAGLLKAPARNVVPLPDGLPFELAAMAEPLAVALRAANLTPLEAGGTAAVLGAGPIGLLTLMALRLRGAGRVVVVDLSASRLELARRLGADETVDAAQGAVEAVRELTGGGADVVVECVGVSATAAASVRMVRNGGAVTWVGNSAPVVEVPMQEVVTREVSLRGSYGFLPREFGAAVAALDAGRVDAAALLGRVAPLEDGPALFEGLARGEIEDPKVVLRP
jgi:L-iditol 2-dehydrogenase